ncbi:MAG: immunoglobulin domain-containing protein [Acidobacteriota bacterium]|nr:immunoglobulin domain-containing protein [Acidobacteriota bacterium]
MVMLLIVTGCGGGWDGAGGIAPVITGQPVSQTVTVGQPATFTVTATSTGTTTYQWFQNGTPITGATSSSYTTPPAASTDSGVVYTVTVTNASGSVTSSPATLTVSAGGTTVNPNAPLIVSQPANQTVNVGQTASFSVTASGAAPLTYQWYKGGVAIAGATSNSYTTPVTVSGDSGSLFTVSVANSLGTVTSAPATLTVITPVVTPPSIIHQPVSQTVTVGQTATFTVTAAGTDPLTYQWFKNGVPVGGSTSSSYTTPPAASGDTGSIYTVVVTNPAGTVTSVPVTLTVTSAPIIVTPPANQTVNAGQTASFSVTATGTGPLTYQWNKGGVAIAGASSTGYTTPPTVAGDSGSLFTVTVTNAAGSVGSAPATLTVNTPPVITVPPANQTVTAGQTASFSVIATGTGPLTYQWYQGGAAIGGATSSTYTTPATASSDSGSVFTVTVTNVAGSATGGPATLTVTSAPIVVSSPANQTVNVGQTATFSVTANGTGPLTYQWSKDGAPVAGATSTSYTTPAAVIGDSGSHFTVTVTNSVGHVTTGPATLTVNSGPTITTPPADQTVNVGQTATFNVVASGTGTLTYQWSKNGTAIPGATGTSYTTPATVIGDSGSHFTVTVTNLVGSVTGGPAALTVNAAPMITTPPADQTVNAGQTATFSVVASGTGPLTYQWFKNGALLTGATSTSYTTPATVTGDSGTHFTVTVTNLVGSVTGGPATLTVNSGPTITTPPADQTVNAGQTATFSVVASGTGPLSYQWFKNGALLSGATATSYTTPAVVVGDSGSHFTVTVTNSIGSATGGPASLTVSTGPTITTPPADVTVNAGQTATFSVVASGSGTLTYQWSKNGTPITGATSTSYTTPATVSGDSGSHFSVSVTNSVGSVSGGPATLTVNIAPTITTPPVDITVNAGQTATFSVVATGTGPLTYQWAKNGTAIPGATATSYTTPAAVTGDSGTHFSVTVTNSAGSATSGPAILTVVTAPTITTPPADQTVNAGNTATFSVVASGTGPLTYQWSKNGTLIPGATSTSYTTPATVSGDTGTHFSVTVSNAAGKVTGGPATLTVNTPPTITTQPASQTVTVGQTATFNVVATGTAPLTYQWYKGGAAIAGATSSTYTTPSTVTGDNASQFTVTVTNVAGSATSMTATLTVKNSVPVASFLACNPIAPNYNATSTLIPTFSGGAGVIGSGGLGSVDITASAVNGSSYTTPPATTAKTYTLTVTGSGGAVAFTTCTVVPLGVTISPVTPAGQTIAPGKVTYSATVSGGATGNVIWSATAGIFVGNVWTSPNAAGTYTITATSADEPSVSATTTVTVSLPVITRQPASENVCLHSSETLSVVANYAGSYQWNLNGTPIPGATSSTYYIPSAMAMDSGTYTVTVSNPAGSVTSNSAKIVVGSSITSNPVGLSILANQTATFSVAASGDAPFRYQWYVISAGASSGAAISGATSSTYTTPAETTNSNGAQFYAVVKDACGNPLTSSSALLVVTDGHTPPSIITQPVGQVAAVGSTATFTVVAAGTPTLTYQWFRIPAGEPKGIAIAGATSTSYTVPSTETLPVNDQDAYYVTVTNNYGIATSVNATLAIGNGILITKQPQNQYVNEGASASFSVTAVSALTLSYQWYTSAPGTSSFTAIPGATNATYTQSSTTLTESGSVYYVVVSNGTTRNVQSSSAALFVGPLPGISNLCNGWTWLGDAQPPTPSCSIQLSAATYNQHGEIVWPNLISTGNIQLSFTITTSDTSTPPADGFAMVLGDPSLGATPTTIGYTGQGLGAEGIPGTVLAFDDYENPGDAPIPYLAIERGEVALWENPYLNLNTNIPALAAPGATISHDYVVSLVQGIMTVTMDGTQVFSGTVSVPPVAYLYFTASTGSEYENAVISNLSATVSAPSN